MRTEWKKKKIQVNFLIYGFNNRVHGSGVYWHGDNAAMRSLDKILMFMLRFLSETHVGNHMVDSLIKGLYIKTCAGYKVQGIEIVSLFVFALF